MEEEEGRGKGIVDTSEGEDSHRSFHCDSPKLISTVLYRLSSWYGNSWDVAFCQGQFKLSRVSLWAKAQHV